LPPLCAGCRRARVGCVMPLGDRRWCACTPGGHTLRGCGEPGLALAAENQDPPMLRRLQRRPGGHLGRYAQHQGGGHLRRLLSPSSPPPRGWQPLPTHHRARVCRTEPTRAAAVRMGGGPPAASGQPNISLVRVITTTGGTTHALHVVFRLAPASCSRTATTVSNCRWPAGQ
jgi:hypothetical protein